MPHATQSHPRGGGRFPLLSTVDFPDDLRRLSPEDLPALASELRAFLVDSVSRTGGHLAAGLGVVELTIALHYVFDTPDDRLIWDVGHQAYPHKILTGRRERMATLRQGGGLSGFPSGARANMTPLAWATPAPPSAPPWAWRRRPDSRGSSAM